MARIDRPWLRRIGGYVPGEGPRPARRQDPEGEPGPAAPDNPGPADGEPGEEDQPGALAPNQPGAPSETEGGEPGELPEAGEPVEPAEAEPPDTSLSLPEEIEEARRKAEQEGRSPWNRHHAPRAFPLEGRYLRGLATRFARMVAKLAEDHADLPDDGDDEWDLNALLRRRFTGRLPHQCRMSREKRKVVVVLDTSPSCEHQARMFGAVAQIAEELGDCEMFDAPNFRLVSHWEAGTWRELPPEEREWQFRNRVVLAFGDFDGIEHICEASRRRGNRIYWFSCEERPQVMEMQRETFVHDYRGHYFPATHLNGLMRAMARVR